jgi:hypothetical protein
LFRVDLNNDPMILGKRHSCPSRRSSTSTCLRSITPIEIRRKWNELQKRADEKEEEEEEELQINRQQWTQFKRQLDTLEESTQMTFVSRPTDFDDLLRATMDFARRSNDQSKQWRHYERRLQALQDKHRRSSPPADLRQELVDVQSQLNHLDELRHSLAPIV